MSWSLAKCVFAPAGKQNIIRFLVTSGCLLSGKIWWAIQISSFWQRIEVFYRPEWIEIMNLKINFKYFQIPKWMLQAGRAEKVDEKMGLFLVFMFLSWVMILKLSKQVNFFNFVLTLAKKSKYVKAICIYASERSRYVLSENVIAYYAMI